jgi:site-specific DNA recombinase
MRAEFAEAKAVGIWVRVSTEDQVRGESPEHHEKRAHAYAEAKGWNVVEVYRLDAVSGKAVMAHPEAQRMLTDMRSGRITGLVFSKLARLARNTRELLEFAEEFRTHGADLVSLQESIDTNSPAGRLFFTMIAAMASWEREEIADRVQASVPIRAKLGKPLGGAAPFGYRWVDKKLQPDPDEAPIRALIHELFVEHQRKKTVARLLNERGYRTRNGSKFSDTTVDRLLRDETAKGHHRANYTKTADRSKNWSLKPESEWVYTEVEAIVPEELWSRANAILSEQRQRLARPARKPVHLFAGYAFCGCGQKMYVWSNSPKYVCSTCRNKIPVADLEAVYQEQLRSFLVSPDDITAHREAAREAMRERERLVEATELELRRLMEREDELFELYSAKSVSKDDFARRHRPISERRAQLEDELPKLQAALDVLRMSLVSQEAVLHETIDLYDRWASLGEEEKRQLIEAITDRITVGRDEVEIALLAVPARNGGEMATRPHGFMAATSCTRAG